MNKRKIPLQVFDLRNQMARGGKHLAIFAVDGGQGTAGIKAESLAPRRKEHGCKTTAQTIQFRLKVDRCVDFITIKRKVPDGE
jgi:hypothetical protein